MVEVMAAGLSGANWSLDAPDFASGARSPGAGLLVIAIAPKLLDPEFDVRLQEHLQNLAQLGVHIPGQAKADRAAFVASEGFYLPVSLVRKIEAFGLGNAPVRGGA